MLFSGERCSKIRTTRDKHDLPREIRDVSVGFEGRITETEHFAVFGKESMGIEKKLRKVFRSMMDQ
jgi:hypothetical protein